MALSLPFKTIRSYPLRSNAAPLLFSSFPFSSSCEPKQSTNPTVNLTQEELNTINLLIPRLCLSDQPTTAIQLISTALLTNLSPKSISYSIVIHSLTSRPDLTQSMSLLNRLRHTPSAHPHLTPISTMLITSYLKKGRLKEALKVYSWVLRPGYPCKVEPMVYRALLDGFCRNGSVLEALKVLRDMVSVHLVPGEGLRNRVYRSLLREARIKEAKVLDEALGCLRDGGECVKVLGLLDQIIGNWRD